MFKPHNYAYQIEVTIHSIFKNEKDGIGGIADASFIEKNPFIAIAFMLGNFYNKVHISFKKKIDNFFAKYYTEMGKSMSEIGEETVKSIAKDFIDIVSTI
ncbi:MAG: hypothetical protein ACOCG5_02920 [Candidatus Alkaliphilus sp. MAG34]|nr:hypothetical protein [Clostridiales bacterium]